VNGDISQEVTTIEGRLNVVGPLSSCITATVGLKIKEFTFTQSSIESVYVGSGVGPNNAAIGELKDSQNFNKPVYNKVKSHVSYARDCVFRFAEH
jgi:hypothetical protein